MTAMNPRTMTMTALCRPSYQNQIAVVLSYRAGLSQMVPASKLLTEAAVEQKTSSKQNMIATLIATAKVCGI